MTRRRAPLQRFQALLLLLLLLATTLSDHWWCVNAAGAAAVAADAAVAVAAAGTVWMLLHKHEHSILTYMNSEAKWLGGAIL